MILSFRTNRSGQTVQTQIRLLLEEQSDQGLHCLPFRLHLLDTLLHGKVALFKFQGDYSKFSGVRIFRIFTSVSFYFQGQLLVNGHNLGRYWPKKGPQVRLYVPKFYLKTGLNEVIMIELENAPCNTPVNCTVAFVDHPLINSTVIPNGNFHVPEILTEYDRHRYH